MIGLSSFVLEGMANWSAQTWISVANWSTHTWEGLQTWSYDSIVGLSNFTQDAIDGMSTWTSEQMRLLGETGLDAYNAIIEGLNQAGDGIQDAADFFQKQGSSIYRYFNNAGEAITAVWVAGLLNEPTVVYASGTVSGAGGRESFILSLGNDAVAPGMGFDIAQLGAGVDTVSGTFSELDGDRIRDFTDQDVLVVEGSSFTTADIRVTYGSAILDIDVDNDGAVDTTIYLEGAYIGANFIVETINGSTTIRVEGAATGIIENGTRGDDIFSGSSGNDLVFDALGNNNINGDAGYDSLVVFSGLNLLNGGADSDFLSGGTQSDELFGDAGNDVIRGDIGSGAFGGADIINGGTGNDIMMGGVGADVFVFSTNDGSDTIADFNAADVTFDAATGYSVNPTGADFEAGVDQVFLNGFATVNAANVMGFVTNTAQGAVFSAEGTDITFYGINSASLAASDFLFM